MLRFRAMTLLACARLGCRALRPPLARRRAATAVRAAAEALPGASAYHIPVLGAECVEWLVTDTSGVYVDATLGGGGHSSLLLERLGPNGKVVGVDRDAKAIAVATARLGEDARFSTVEAVFDDGIAEAARRHGPVSGVLMDLGVSSRQLDDGARGFSHRHAGPLDMRMGSEGATAADLLAGLRERDLSYLLKKNADEPLARRVAKAVAAAMPLTTTDALADVVAAAVPTISPPAADARRRAKTVARVFQALRVEVNDELGALDRMLLALPDHVRPGGRVVALSYHSLEDRRVKRVFRTGKLRGDAESDAYGEKLVPFKPLTRKALAASDAEVEANPRARSAKLRVAERTTWGCKPS